MPEKPEEFLIGSHARHAGRRQIHIDPIEHQAAHLALLLDRGQRPDVLKGIDLMAEIQGAIG